MVYVIRRAGSDDFKIGYTRGSVIDRLANLQTGSPDTLYVYGVIIDGTPSLERKLHSELASYQIRGEWFRCHHQVIQNAFERISSNAPAGRSGYKRNLGRTIDGKVGEHGSYCRECDDLIANGQEFCSSKCEDRWTKRAEHRQGNATGGKKARKGRVCPVCGDPLTARQTYCSSRCRTAAHRGVELYRCFECGKQMGEDRTTKYCSHACTKAAYDRRHGRPRQRIHVDQKTCKQCGEPVGIKQLYCGPACRQAAYRERKKKNDTEQHN